MLNLSSSQMVSFDHLARSSFAQEMVRHAGAFAPAATRVMGTEALRRSVALALDQAGRYRFTRRGPLQFWVELTLMFGWAFDTDPQYPWVRATLHRWRHLPEVARADKLHEALMPFAATMAGADGGAELRARDRMLAEMETLIGPKHTTEEAAALYARLYPEKAEAVGPEGIAGLVQTAWSAAEERRQEPARFGPLYLAVMATFGHGCLSDPQFPWVGGALAQAPDQSAAFTKLQSRFARYIAAA